MQFRNGVFQSHCVLVVAGNISSSSSTSSVIIKGLVHGLQDVWVAAHAEVVVGTPHCHFLLLVGQMGARELLCHAIDVVEVAVRLVLVLLVELIVVEALIVEFLRLRIVRVCNRGGLCSRWLLGGRREWNWPWISVSRDSIQQYFEFQCNALMMQRR